MDKNLKVLKYVTAVYLKTAQEKFKTLARFLFSKYLHEVAAVYRKGRHCDVALMHLKRGVRQVAATKWKGAGRGWNPGNGSCLKVNEGGTKYYLLVV